ncbi:MAG: hypothetical protein WC593_09300 [Methanoregula sp.]
MLCYSVGFVRESLCERSHVSRHLHGRLASRRCRLFWINDQKIVDTIDILLTGL